MKITIPRDQNPGGSADVSKLGSQAKGNPNAVANTNHKPSVGG